MDRGAWLATILGGHERVGHNLETEQQQIFHINDFSILQNLAYEVS